MSSVAVGTAVKLYGASKMPSGKGQASAIGGAIGGGAATIFAGAAVTALATDAAVSVGLGVAGGAAAGAALGSVVPIVGTIIGAAAGVAIATLGGGKITQHEGPNSVSGHKIIISGLVKAQRWDDIDAMTKVWFDADQGTDEERARFKPKGAAKLKNGKPNYSMVARFGHQAATYCEVQATLKNGQTLVLAGKGRVGLVCVAARGDKVVLTKLEGAAAVLPDSKPDGTPEGLALVARAKAVAAQAAASGGDATSWALPAAAAAAAVLVAVLAVRG